VTVNAYTCRKHNIEGLTSFCPSCLTEFENRKPAASMSVAERVAALKAIPEQLTIPFDSIHQWYTELMGRDVWTHELAHPEQLIEELEQGERVSLGDVIAKLPWDKPVLLVDPESGTVEQV
jgi:hypothetical protein